MSSRIAPGIYTPQRIESLPNLCISQCCTLKLDDGTHRVWLCRVGGGVTIEKLQDGRWDVVDGDCYSRSARVK